MGSSSSSSISPKNPLLNSKIAVQVPSTSAAVSLSFSSLHRHHDTLASHVLSCHSHQCWPLDSTHETTRMTIHIESSPSPSPRPSRPSLLRPRQPSITSLSPGSDAHPCRPRRTGLRSSPQLPPSTRRMRHVHPSYSLLSTLRAPWQVHHPPTISPRSTAFPVQTTSLLPPSRFRSRSIRSTPPTQYRLILLPDN
jgi:hypothetical protein